jgi:SAM-dependent methyltransferase
LSWKPSLQAFFDTRASNVVGAPSVLDLCFISGREPRLWSDPAMRADLAASIVSSCGIGPSSHVLEVGCAAGFLAQLVAPQVSRYEGIDLAGNALRIARRLRLPNAKFIKAEGERLPFPAGHFDAAFCYDVYTNFPRFEDGAGLISQMLRVVKSGGRVLVGSIPDAATEAAYIEHVPKVVAGFDKLYSPAPLWSIRPKRENFIDRLRTRFRKPSAEPAITGYYFRKQDFIDFADKLNASVEITDIHALNPYLGYRFNAIYQSNV